MDKNDITLNYAFQEYIPEKDLENKGIKDVAPVLTYEEPRWTFKNTSEAMNIIKESDASLYEKIQDYVKEQHLPSENVLYLDFGKSLRYDDEYMGDFSMETLSDKLDNRFIVRYSHDNDEGNLIDGGDEIIINDKELVSLFNGMIEGHVKENIQKYDEYKTQREAAQKNKEIEKDYTNFLDRKSLLADSKIITDEMLNVLYELSEEDVNFDSLEKFTEKKYRELNTEERTELIKKLSNADYKQYKNCYISTSKLLYEKPETLVKEIKALNVLNDLGYTVYLLPFGYARNNQEFLQKSADSMLKSQFLEMKTILSTSKNAGQSAFKDSRKQSNNVILSFTEDITPHKAMQGIWNYINGAKKNLIKNNESYDFSGELFLHFEKDNKTVLYEISKEGEFIQKDVHAFGLKKTLTLNESQVVELFSDKTHPLPKFTIQSNPNSVNEQMKENLKNNLSEQIWLWKDYDDLSGHLESPDGKSYFEYDWTTKEYKITSDSVWDSFIDADPTRDTSLSAFKDYAQDYIKNNIAKNKDIVFERKYIDTEKWLKEEEKEMTKTESLADKYNRMEKLFEDKLSHLGSGNGETFNELCKWVEEEFPEKDSEAVLLEATSRMLEEMFDFDEFNYQNYDDVYGFGDGAEWRFDLSESAAKKLLSGEILNYYEAQNYIWEKTKKEFAELKNNPQYKDEIEITDRINSAFRIADYLYPEFTKEIDKEKNLLPDERPQYSKEEKKNVINNAFERLDAAFKENRVFLEVDEYDEDRLIIVDKTIPLKHFETLIKGRDAVNFGKESLSFTRPNAEQLQTGIKNGWGLKEILTGYDVFQDRFNESGQMLAELEAEKEFVPSEYVLSKLKEKGIEVVTEKEEFERILQRESHLQRMAGSLSFEEQKRYFTFDEDDSQKFHAQIDEWQKDNINIAKLVTVGKIPPVMKILNIDDNPIEIQYSTLNKIVRDNPLYPNDEQGHKLSIDDIYAIPYQLADPVMVFKSRTRADSFVFFTERKDRENRSILIPLAVNKKKGRIIINEITSMYGRNNEIDFVKSNIDENNLIYADKKRSLDWERSSQVQFLTQRFSNPSFELSILTKERLVNFLSSNSRKNNVQNMVSNGTTYGFTHEGKIYLNPDVLSAEVAMHEYTHLWDNLTRKDNTELWSKGLQIFKGTSLWNEVVNDENYADIKDDENLVLSECHARITGKVAEAVLNRIAEQDGTEKQAEMVDWDKETINFIFENYRDVFAKNGFETVAEFTSATMRDLFIPVEQQKRDISNSSAYERMEKLFEGKMTYLGSVNGETFNELCKWVEEEFPEKDSKGVLLEATSRMIEANLDFGEFNYQAFDDVGAQWRFDLSDSAAKKLISGEILTLSDAQSLIWEKTEKEFAELKNNPQYKDEIEITDRINSAFRIADFLYPEITKEIDKEKNLLPDEWPQYSNEEKKAVINNAFEKIKSAFDEKKLRLSDSRTDELVFEGSDKWLLLGDFKALIKGKDAAEHGKESLSYIRPNAEQLHDGIENGWEFDEITTGYAIFQNQDLDVKDGFTPKFISKLDDMNVFESDGDAAKQYGIDHNCRILEEKKDIWIGDEDLEYYSYPDIPENRRIMKENGWLLEQPLEFEFSEFTEKDFNRIRDELFKDNPKEDYYGRLHIGSLHVEFVINQNDGWVDTNYYILGEKGEGETQFGVPYGHFPGHQFIANLFTDNTYEEFKEKVTKAVLDDIAEEGTLKPEAMRPLVDWNDEQQCNELYHTKLVESARVNEIVIAPYSREERDVEAVRDFVSKIVNLPVLGVSDDIVFAVLDNIGRVQDEKPGDFLKIRKDGSVEHISALGPVEKEPVEVLHIINSFAEDHASVSEEGSQQRKDYEYINSLYEKMAEKNVTVDVPSVDSYKEMVEIIQEQIEKESGIKVDERIADEIYSRYKDHDLTLKYNENGSFTVYNDADGKYTNPITIKDAVKQVMAWDDKELSELHPGTADDETIGKIKGYLEELEHVNEQIAYNQNVTLKDVNEKLKELNMENKEFKVTHSVIFPCGFIFPDSIGKTEREQNNYRKKIYKKLQEKYGFGDNDAETGYWPEDDRAEASFNIHFAVSVPKEIKTDIEKVNVWIKDVEKFVKEECGCTFINWQGGERYEQTFVSEKQYKMQQERNNDFAHPNAEDLDYASPKDIKEYCKLNSKIELTDEQVREIHNFYDNNDQFALYVSPAGNLYVRDEYKEELISADSELLKAGNHLRTLEGKERLEYLLKNTSNDEPEWSKGLLNQTSNDSDERLRIVSDVLSDSFATLDRHDGFWQLLLDYGADPTRAIRIAAEDANLGDNLNWLLNNVPESHLNQIFSDNGYADAVFDIAKKSVEHDMDSWHGGQDIGFEGFKRIARLCEREADADRYYGELLEKAFEYPVEPKIVQLLDTPELLAEKMNNSKVHPNEPSISRDQASSILDYCNYENIKFYVAKDGGIYSLDVSEDYNGEGMAESNFGIVANGIEYARKAQDLEYPCYSTESFSIVEELWQKEHQFANPSVENKIKNVEKNEIIEENTTMNDNELNQPEEVKAALVEAGIARSELYNNVESIPVSEEARNAMLSASYAGQGGIIQKAFADNGIEIDLSTANALENCFSQIEAMTKYTADGHDLFHSGNGVDTISEHTIEYSEANKAWFVHEKNWLALSAIKGNEAEPEDYMEKAGRVGDKNWALSCEELVKYVYQEIKEDGEMEKEFPDTFKKLEKLNEYLEAPERIKETEILEQSKNPLDVLNEVVKKEEKENIAETFRTELLDNMKTTKNPFISTKNIINRWQVENPEKAKDLIKYLEMQNCTTKEGYNKFFKEVIGLTKKEPVIIKSQKKEKENPDRSR